MFRRLRLARRRHTSGPGKADQAWVEGMEPRVLFNTITVTLAENQTLAVNEGGDRHISIEFKRCAGSVTLTGDNLQAIQTRDGATVNGLITDAAVHVTSSSDPLDADVICDGINENPNDLDHLQDCVCDVAIGDFIVRNLGLAGLLQAPRLRSLTLDTVTSSEIDLAAPLTSFRAKNLYDTTFNVDGTIGTFYAGSYTGSTPSASSLRASSLGNFTITHDYTADLTLGAPTIGYQINRFNVGGNLGGTFTVPGSVNYLSGHDLLSDFTGNFGSIRSLALSGNYLGSITAGSLGTGTVGGYMLNGNLNLIDPYNTGTYDLGSFGVHNYIDQSTITSMGNIGSISTMYTQYSHITAGLSSSFNWSMPLSTSDFSSPAIIRSYLSDCPNKSAFHFQDSFIESYKIDLLHLGNVQTNNGGAPFGIASSEIDKLIMSIENKALAATIRSASDVNTALQKDGLSPSALGDLEFLVAPVPPP